MMWPAVLGSQRPTQARRICDLVAKDCDVLLCHQS
jgi:hypothetical protein